MLKIIVPCVSLLYTFFLSEIKTNVPVKSVHEDTLQYPEERHFKNLRQLTFGGDNAEAYFSFDGKYVIFQRTDPKNRRQLLIPNKKSDVYIEA